MLAIVVLILAGLYFALYYTGAFERLGESLDRFSGDVKRRSGEASRGLLDGDVERRLKVFEDFLSGDETDADESGHSKPPAKDDESGVY